MAPHPASAAVLLAFFALSIEDVIFVATAFLGGCLVGSFLNVVVHRVPAGRSVVAGRSACPACGHLVRARDNVPVLGWLMLGGRCRDCGSPIAAEYPLVEAACGIGLAAVAAGEIFSWRSTGGSLPVLDRLIMLGEWRWLIGWLAKAATLLTVAGWSLLFRAGHTVTWQTVAASILVIGGMAVAGSGSGLWRAVVDAATPAILLLVARATLREAPPLVRRVSATGRMGPRWFLAAAAAAVVVPAWTLAGGCVAGWLARWFG